MCAMGMNLRNHLITRLNGRQEQELAKSKLRFKALLSQHGILTPRTYGVIKRITDLEGIEEIPIDFVVKPDKGHGGNGILLLRRENDYWLTPNNHVYRLRDLKRHIEMILDGQFSDAAENDLCLIEERIYPSPALTFDKLVGLPDVRVVCHNHAAVLAMIRYPTPRSSGKANLTAGAYGIGLDLETGRVQGLFEKQNRVFHPLIALHIPKEFAVPRWQEVVATAERASRLSGLGFSGVDIIIDDKGRILVLEINGFPGLEIQNVDRRSLRDGWDGPPSVPPEPDFLPATPPEPNFPPARPAIYRPDRRHPRLALRQLGRRGNRYLKRQ